MSIEAVIFYSVLNFGLANLALSSKTKSNARRCRIALLSVV